MKVKVKNLDKSPYSYVPHRLAIPLTLETFKEKDKAIKRIKGLNKKLKKWFR